MARIGGRKAGTPNKVTKALKDAILAALDEVGGQTYLVGIAREDPKTFCALLGRVLPMQVGGDPNNPVVSEIRWVVVDPHP